ncbi:sugar-binding protein [Kineosporia sp. J2-2]|uniref:Sugar-binding protein n=2 Tax=Kineosporia corallincola TaxID=2835133 RepID=A0ABS5T9C4_9ACTN|nr:sugar-binding protein [Kineosporia corallincola]
MAMVLSGCGGDAAASDSVYANEGATVGISMPNKTSSRWTDDGTSMAQQFKAMGYKVEINYANDTSEQQAEQIKAMVDNDDQLLVIAAVDGGALGDVLAQAAAKDIPVIAYDRLLTDTTDVGYQATFDNERVGVLQGQYIVSQLGLDSGQDGPFNVELFAGSPTDANANSFYKGSMSVLRKYINSGKIVVRSNQTQFKAITTDLYSGDIAKERMSKILKANYTGGEKVDAVLSPYDGMTIGIIDALKAAGYGTNYKPLPITTGQDSEIPSVKSIINNEQSETIFKDTRELAKVAVQQGNALLTGADPIINDTTTFDNGKKVVPTYLLYPVEVVRTNYQTLLVDSGYITKADLAA